MADEEVQVRKASRYFATRHSCVSYDVPRFSYVSTDMHPKEMHWSRIEKDRLVGIVEQCTSRSLIVQEYPQEVLSQSHSSALHSDTYQSIDIGSETRNSHTSGNGLDGEYEQLCSNSILPTSSTAGILSNTTLHGTHSEQNDHNNDHNNHEHNNHNNDNTSLQNTIMNPPNEVQATVDWGMVASLLDNTKTPMECFMFYRNEISPHINNNPWTKEENSLLSHLAIKYDEHNWCQISSELGTNRPPIHCLQQYQQCHNLNLINNKEFSPMEIDILSQSVQLYGEHKKWQHIANTLPGRSSTQCYNRWYRLKSRSTNVTQQISENRWTENENKRLLFAAISLQIPTLASTKKTSNEISVFDHASYEEVRSMLLVVDKKVKDKKDEIMNKTSNSSSNNYFMNTQINTRNKNKNSYVDEDDEVEDEEEGGADRAVAFGIWQELARFLPGRDCLQVRDKWVRDGDPTLSTAPFTPLEDTRLRRLVDVLGPGHWVECAKWLPGRSDSAVSYRWNYVLSNKEDMKEYKKTASKKRALTVGTYGRASARSSVDADDFETVLLPRRSKGRPKKEDSA